MARYKDFIQDEDRPFGVGTFVLDDGSEHYLDDAPRARSVIDELYGSSPVVDDVRRESTNIAERGSVDRRERELDGKQRYENAVAKLAGETEPNAPFRGIDTGPDPRRRAVAGPGGGDSSEPELLESREPIESREPPPPSQAELENANAVRRYQNAAAATPRQASAGTDPRALGPGVAVDKSFSKKGGLAPDEYNTQAADRRGAFDASNQTVARHYAEDEAASARQSEQLRAEALGMKKVNDAKELGLQRQQMKYQDDRAWLEKDVDAWYDKKADPDGGMRARRGVLGNVGSVIAQMLGAYASVVSGTPNFANQILNKKMEQSVEAQLEDFRRGRVKRDSQLARMAERGMSLDQMRSALKLQQEMALQKEIKAAALDEGSREAKQAAESLLMSRQEKFVTDENKFRTEALGEQTVSGDYVRPTGPRQKTALEYTQDVNKMLSAQNEGEDLARGGKVAREERYREEDRSDKQAERQAARGEKVDAGVRTYADKVAKEAAPLKKVDSAISRLETIYKQHNGLPGVGTVNFKGLPYTEQRKLADEVEQLQQTILNSLIQANPGSASEGDAQRFAIEAFGKGTEEGTLNGLHNARKFVESKLSAIDASATPEERDAYQRREDEARIERAKKRRNQSSTGEAY